MDIQMVDLRNQYLKIKEEVDSAIQECIDSGRFIGGDTVEQFCRELAEHLGCGHVIGCGNGTDALQIALMALDLQPGDEVIVPAFTFAAPLEMVVLAGLKPIMVDVNEADFNIDISEAETKVTENTRAIIPVHLFGQPADMEAVLTFAERHQLKVIEDNAQSISAKYRFSDGRTTKTGTMGDIGTFSFFPSKNLACFGDGGALCTNDDALARRIRMIATHGWEKKYYHSILGLNSRLDSIQAAVLRVKLKYLDGYTKARQQTALIYDRHLGDIDEIGLPERHLYRTHVFHQYTIRVVKGDRDGLKEHLKSKGIPSMVYYPLPLHRQKAYERYWDGKVLPVSERLCREVLSLPMHTEMTEEQICFIAGGIKEYFC